MARTHIVSGTDGGAGDAMVNKTHKALPSWSLYSGEENRRKQTNKYLYVVINATRGANKELR